MLNPNTTRLDPPSGVAVLYQGVRYDLDATLRLDGQDPDGMIRWSCYGPPHLTMTRPPEVRIARLPAKTAVAVPVVHAAPGGYRFAQLHESVAETWERP